MFVRPAGGRQSRSTALRRLQSASALLAHSPRAPLLPLTSSSSSTSTSTFSPWASSLRPLGVNRRLLSSSSASSPARPGLRPLGSSSPSALSSQPADRSLATAVGEYVTTDGAPPSQSSVAAAAASASQLSRLYGASAAPSDHSPLWELRPHNVSAPLFIDEGAEPIKRVKTNNLGIPGDLEEMLSILDACFKIGNMDRAALIMKRICLPQFKTPDVSIADLQNRFLYAYVNALLNNPDPKSADALHKWFELELGAGRPANNPITTTPENIALMVKASLLTSRGADRERLVERYMGMAPGDTGLEVLHMTDILNDQDRAAITELFQDYNLAPDEDSPEVPTTLFEQALSNIEGAELPTAAEINEAAGIADTAENISTVPEVIGTPQKGAGLRTLKKTLSLFREIPDGRDIASLGVEERRQIQSRLERDCVDAAVDRWADENDALLKMGLNTTLSTASLNSRLHEWHRDLEQRIIDEIERINAADAPGSKGRDARENVDRFVYGPFLRQAPPSRLAAVTIVSTLSSMAIQGADKGLSISNAITQIAKVAEEDIRLLQTTSAIRKGISKQNAGKTKAVHKNATKSAKKFSRAKAMRPGKQIHLPQGEEAELEAIKSAEAVAAANAAANQATEVSDHDFHNTVAEAAAAAEAQTEAPLEPATSRMPDSWPITIKAKVGSVLLSMLLDSARITVAKECPETGTLLTESQPAFSRMNQYKRGKRIGMLIANTAIIDMLKREPRGDFLARHLPMVVEPQPWKGFEKGGFLESPAPLIRVKDSRKDQKIYAEAAIARGDMDQVLKGLDVLGRTAWRVNRPIFETMLKAWNSGEAIADIPPIDPVIPIPPEPSKDEDPLKRRNWLKAVKTAENERSGLHSVRCFMNFQMEIARAFRDQTFYFPHNVDFRGRAYPIPTYFNHMGADHVRGLLIFGKGKKLGADGLRWLQVQLANVYGYDKASLADRAQFAVDNLEHVRDSARDPLGGSRWWLGAEDPWQCLAACIELAEAYKLDDPAEFVSHLPVHQDGTCNGLQHYAALGGDSWGAKQVNLEPSDRPADVYSAVADIVKDAIAEDAAQGNEVAQALVGKIKRKVVKQTVMTNVYGVTFTGARKQVLKQLDSLYPTLEKESGVSSSRLASYIATLIFKALSTMFSGAHDIQNWLGESGGRVCRIIMPDQIQRLISGGPDNAAKTPRMKLGRKTRPDDLMNNFRSTLVWTTPLRMPVVQPYRSAETRVIETCLQDLVLSVPARNDPVNKRKQLQAFPPNFIHSLDASHMLLSALECDALGLQFAAVHDSFWTHASDVGTMNRVLRDAFIRIHSEDVVGRLSAELQARYKGALLLTRVKRNTPVGAKVLEWRKNAKRTSLQDELVAEHQRLECLKSTDPKVRARGEAMVTPGSIYATHAEVVGEEELVEAEPLAEYTLGEIPEEELKGEERIDSTILEKTVKAKSASLKDEMAGLVAEADDADADADVYTAPPRLRGKNMFENVLHKDDDLTDAEERVKVKQKYESKQHETIPVWVPLTFPPVPAKGDFDVRRLKNSDYFFS